MMTLELNQGGAASKIFGYDGSNDLALRTAFTSTSSVGYMVGDAMGDRLVTCCNDGGATKVIATSIGANTNGSAVTVSSVNANTRPKLKLITANLFVIFYQDSGGDWQAKSYSISGNTISLDQTLMIAGGAASGRSDLDIIQMLGARLVLKYTNSSQYPTVVGINCSPGSLTKDASPTVVNSAATSDGTEKVGSITRISSTRFYLFHNLTGGGGTICVGFTDTGTSLTKDGSSITFPEVHLRMCPMSNDKAGIMMSYISSVPGYLSPFLVSGGVITDNEFVDAVSGSGGSLHRCGTVPIDAGIMQQLNLALLGDTDGDGIQWFVAASRISDALNEGHVQFLGVDVASGLARNLRSRWARCTTGLSALNPGETKVIGNGPNQFILLYNTDPTLKYKVVNL